MSKINIGLLYGGQSSEHEVSLLSAAGVWEQLDRDKFNIQPFAIDKQGQWYHNDNAYLLNGNGLVVKNAHSKAIAMADVFAQCDVIFPMMHGPIYEDGVIQGCLTFCGKPYVSADVLSSACAMDKVISKKIVAQSGIPVVPFVSFTATQWHGDKQRWLEAIDQTLAYPVFVKPNGTGSSVGIHRVTEMAALSAAIDDALRYDSRVLVELGIQGREIELAVLETLPLGGEPRVSLPGEVITQGQHDFYSYEAKYLDAEGAVTEVPAQLTETQRMRCQQIAKHVFCALHCDSMARIDLFFDETNDIIYFNEANTLPGFTEISLYPQMMAASGLAYPDLLTALIELAMARHEQQQRLTRDWQQG